MEAVLVRLVERACAEGKSIHSCDSSRSFRSGEDNVAVALRSGSCAVVGRDVGSKLGWRNAIMEEYVSFKPATSGCGQKVRLSCKQAQG